MNQDVQAHVCGEPGCVRSASLAIRLEVDEEEKFTHYCTGDFRAAVEFLRVLRENEGAGITNAAPWDCCKEHCGKKAIVTLRVRTNASDEMKAGHETMPFCRAHLGEAHMAMEMLKESVAA